MGKVKTILLQAVIGLVPVFYYLSVWNKLPESVPLHYNINFEPDRFGSKTEMLLVLIFIFLVVMTTSAIINNINKIDPKRKFTENSRLMNKISWTMVVFLALISMVMVYQTLNYNSQGSNELVHKFTLALLGLFFTALGNFINNVKPNYFVGIRTPWALEDPENWKQTHHLGSKLFFFGGLTMFALILFLPLKYSGYVAAFTIIPMALIPIIYSFYIFRQKKNGIS